MGRSLAAEDPDVAFWRDAMRPVAEETARDTGPCLASDGAVHAFAQKIDGVWFRLEGDSDGNAAEPLEARFCYYRRLVPFIAFVVAAVLGGCAALDAFGLCPLHGWPG